MTGVYKFTKTSVFSDLNNLNDLTFSTKAGTLLGYTQQEVESYFSQEIDALAAKEKLKRSEMVEKLRLNFNGYRFGVDASSGALSASVYNPFAMNHTFAANEMVKKWFASGSPTFLIRKIEETKFEEISPEGLLTSFSTLNHSYNPDEITALSLLYYAGYATMSSFITNRNMVKLASPNLEISQATKHLSLICQRNISKENIKVKGSHPDTETSSG